MQFADLEREGTGGHGASASGELVGSRIPEQIRRDARKAPPTPDSERTDASSTANRQDRGSVPGETEETEETAADLGDLPRSDLGGESGAQASYSAPSPVDSGLQSMPSRGAEALIIKNTCRSGEVVRYPGDVVIFGDVNPGAEIVAGGDIMVLGALRGMAHAGSDGDLKATIFALNLESHRLQIGSHSGERPRGSRKDKSGGKPVNPQIAYLRRRSIYVAPFESARGGPAGAREYHGGVPYEG